MANETSKTAPDLKTLATSHRTDKWNSHWYADHYEAHFSPWRWKAARVLEIGVGGYEDPKAGGESLRMWKEFFPQGTIVGLDIHDKSPHAEDRIRIVQGSQTDVAVLDRLIRDHGPFDIIVDDGSHDNKHVAVTFEHLFRHGLKDDGIYAVEDLQTAYWPSFHGRTRVGAKGTSMAYFKAMCDGLNFREWHLPGHKPTYVQLHATGLHFYHNLVFVQKGDNSEQSNLIANNRAPRFALAGDMETRAVKLIKSTLEATPSGTRLLGILRERRRRTRAANGS